MFKLHSQVMMKKRLNALYVQQKKRDMKNSQILSNKYETTKKLKICQACLTVSIPFEIAFVNHKLGLYLVITNLRYRNY